MKNLDEHFDMCLCSKYIPHVSPVWQVHMGIAVNQLERWIITYKSVLCPNQAALAMAMAIGWRDNIEE